VFAQKALQMAKDRLWRFFSQSVRGERSFRDRFREYWHVTYRQAQGLKLLREWLSPEQLAQLDKNNCFDVIGCYSGKRYRIRHDTVMNIYEIDHAIDEQASGKRKARAARRLARVRCSANAPAMPAGADDCHSHATRRSIALIEEKNVRQIRSEKVD
jgi:hypothetical protein